MGKSCSLERAQVLSRCFPHPRRLPMSAMRLRAAVATWGCGGVMAPSFMVPATRLTPVSDGNSEHTLQSPSPWGTTTGKAGSEIQLRQFQLRRHTMQYKCLFCASHWRQREQKEETSHEPLHSMLSVRILRFTKPTTAGMLQEHFISK